jgi:hypothetical protein
MVDAKNTPREMSRSILGYQVSVSKGSASEYIPAERQSAQLGYLYF